MLASQEIHRSDTGNEQILVTRVEAARLLSLSPTEIDIQRRSGRLIAKRNGRRVLFSIAELRRWADDLPSDEFGA